MGHFRCTPDLLSQNLHSPRSPGDSCTLSVQVEDRLVVTLEGGMDWKRMLEMVCFLIRMLDAQLSVVCENSLSYTLVRVCVYVYVYFNKKLEKKGIRIVSKWREIYS